MTSRMTYPERQMYADFISEFGVECWACKWQPLPALESVAFNPVERHHIIGGSGRRHDRRCIVNLCKVHHMLTHGETIRANNGMELPQLTLANVLWLKLTFDPGHYDPAFLAGLRIKSNETLFPEKPIYNVFEG